MLLVNCKPRLNVLSCPDFVLPHWEKIRISATSKPLACLEESAARRSKLTIAVSKTVESRHNLLMNDDSPNMPPSSAEQVQMLFVRHVGAIRAFVRALLPPLADADDVLQETFLTVSRKAASFAPGTNFVAWACGIARLVLLESFRQKKRTNVLSESFSKN